MRWSRQKNCPLRSKRRLVLPGGLGRLRFYLQSGRLRVTVVSANGKEATITLLSAGDFIGEDSLAGIAEHRSVTVTAITSSNAMRFTRTEMVRVMHDEQAFSDLFLSIYSLAASELRRILSISFSTPAKSDWPGSYS